MVETRRRDYGTPIELHQQGDITDEGQVGGEEVAPLARAWRISVFENMEDHGGGSMVRDRYSGRAEGIPFND